MLKHSGVIKFQFQTGAIKRWLKAFRELQIEGRFNSKLVRLKVS